jgi:(1->4)-alpha-D-glucan 1-alpha-D-glucosylmutase
VVEKILEPCEQLPESWACAGTTGYDALRHVGGLFVDPAGESPLTDLYAEVTREPADFAELAYELKRRAADTALAAEVHRLAALRPEIDDGADAVAELMAAFPVYRSYLPGWGDGYLDEALQAAVRRRPGLERSLDRVAAAVREAGTEFSVRFQQTSGMVMAKGVEDTAFYRYNRFVALNEVGGDPTEFGVTPSAFHEACTTRQERWPLAMTALSTHDTKRSEDVRGARGAAGGVGRRRARVDGPAPSTGPQHRLPVLADARRRLAAVPRPGVRLSREGVPRGQAAHVVDGPERLLRCGAARLRRRGVRRR